MNKQPDKHFYKIHILKIFPDTHFCQEKSIKVHFIEFNWIQRIPHSEFLDSVWEGKWGRGGTSPQLKTRRSLWMNLKMMYMSGQFEKLILMKCVFKEVNECNSGIDEFSRKYSELNKYLTKQNVIHFFRKIKRENNNITINERMRGRVEVTGVRYRATDIESIINEIIDTHCYLITHHLDSWSIPFYWNIFRHLFWATITKILSIFIIKL